MTDPSTHPRRLSFLEEWEPGIKVEVIMTGEIGEEQLQALEGFIRRQRRLMYGRAAIKSAQQEIERG